MHIAHQSSTAAQPSGRGSPYTCCSGRCEHSAQSNLRTDCIAPRRTYRFCVDSIMSCVTCRRGRNRRRFHADSSRSNSHSSPNASSRRRTGPPRGAQAAGGLRHLAAALPGSWTAVLQLAPHTVDQVWLTEQQSLWVDRQCDEYALCSIGDKEARDRRCPERRVVPSCDPGAVSSQVCKKARPPAAGEGGHPRVDCLDP